ncbi:helix-turn-helix domain-containing protein [Eoetvoesiella caeni]
MLSVLDVADYLGVSRQTVYSLAAPTGPIPCYRIGRRVLFLDDDIQNYLNKCRYTEANRDGPAPSRPTVRLKSETSDLLSIFRELGCKPKLTPGPSVRKKPKNY